MYTEVRMQAPLKQHAHNVLIIAILPTPYESNVVGGAYWYNRLPDLMAREMNNYTRWLVSFYWKLTRSFIERMIMIIVIILFFSSQLWWEWGELCCTVWFHLFTHVFLKKMWNSWLEFFFHLFKNDIRHSTKDQPSNKVLHKGAHIMHLVLISLLSS